MRPYIICHMVASIDGRIDCSMVDKISGDEYYSTLEELECASSLEGRVTMAHYSALPEPFVPKENVPFGRSDTHVAAKSSAYTIAVDTRGTLRWPDEMSKCAPLIVICSERASVEYVDTLRRQNISYIVIGKDCIDLPRAMEILHDVFGVERLAVLGGGHINGGFLSAGLIDEVSLLVAPGIDGRKGMTALFDGIEDMKKVPAHLKLDSFDRLDNDVLWLRYLVK